MKKALNVKNMKETLINYSGIQDEMERIWNTCWQMATLGFISQDEWKKFFDCCKGWYIEDDQVKDSENDDAVVWTYNAESEYRA